MQMGDLICRLAEWGWVKLLDSGFVSI